jgi:indolepyruvate decarboxylase
VSYHLLPEAFGCKNWVSARVSTVAELDQVLDHIESHDGAAYIEVMIPNEESQPMPEETIESGYKLKTPEVG